MGYIINKDELPCTRHAKGKTTSNIYNKKVFDKRKHNSKKEQLTPELPYKKACVSTSHDNYR
jgi:hypothetical protein